MLSYFTTNKPFYKDLDYENAYVDLAIRDFPIIRFKALDALDGIHAAFTTRLGGVSDGYLSSLNLGFHRGDTPENVRTNYERIAQRLGLTLSQIALTDQVHGTTILNAGPDTCLGNEFTRKVKDADGLYTARDDIALSATFADCVPIFLADENAHLISLVHSGWRGTVGRIGAKAVDILKENGADPSRITAVIGPSICENNYEVTGEVIDAFAASFTPEQMKHIAYQTDDIHYQLDLWAACVIYLHEAGLPLDHIHIAGLCTCENHEYLYSHRYTNGKRGNLNGFLWMTPEQDHAR